jgi:hypothetical protein
MLNADNLERIDNITLGIRVRVKEWQGANLSRKVNDDPLGKGRCDSIALFLFVAPHFYSAQICAAFLYKIETEVLSCVLH